ncbi:MAG TPA: hypothetical protein VNV86_08710 [Candidatus Acidoferrum sp.]|jgi:hypothetical protein|nr:hypothetical protein [Candidatus Acidoferrum sp.]
MRPFLLAMVFPALLAGAPKLEIVRQVIAQSEGGIPVPAGFEHVPGETLFFSCRVAGYSKTAEEKVHVAYSVQAFDPKGVPLTELYKNELVTDVSPQDKEWLPKIVTEIQLPPLITAGKYKIVVKAEDLFGKTNAELAVPFEVRGHDVEASETLVVRNFQFLRGEEDTHPMEKPGYKPGDPLWVKFDIIGYKYGAQNKIDISYVTSFLSPSGKVLWTQPEPATEQSESFYPKRYVAAQMGLNLLPNTKAGEYTIVLTVKDVVGGQSVESKHTFTVE